MSYFAERRLIYKKGGNVESNYFGEGDGSLENVEASGNTASKALKNLKNRLFSPDTSDEHFKEVQADLLALENGLEAGQTLEDPKQEKPMSRLAKLKETIKKPKKKEVASKPEDATRPRPQTEESAEWKMVEKRPLDA